jgi:hypothetical protein
LVDRYVVQARIAKIREYVALLRKIRGMASEAGFVSDPLVYGNAERYLQLAIQAVLDVSNHIVADMNLSLPADNRELFDLLAKRKALPALEEAHGHGRVPEHPRSRVSGNRSAPRIPRAERSCRRLRKVHQSGQQAALIPWFPVQEQRDRRRDSVGVDVDEEPAVRSLQCQCAVPRV